MRRVELLRQLPAPLFCLRGFVVGPLAVRAPVTLVGAGVGVEHGDVAVAIAVGDKHLVAEYGKRSGRAQMRRVVAIGLDATLPDLQQEFSVLGEFEDMPIAVTIAGEPDIVIRIDEDAVLAASGTAVAIGAPLFRAGLALDMRRVETAAIEPLIFAGLRWPAPALEVFAVRAELDDGRCGPQPFSWRCLPRACAGDGSPRHCRENPRSRRPRRRAASCPAWWGTCNRLRRWDSDRFLGLYGGVKPADDSRKRGRRQHSTRDDVLSHVTAPPDRAIVCSSDTIAL